MTICFKIFRFHLGAACFSVSVLLSSVTLAADQSVWDLGKKVFVELAQPSCKLCHTLADAGAVGKVGPSLDELKPDAARVKAALTNGVGVMPVYEGLPPEQVEAVALYVAAAVQCK